MTLALLGLHLKVGHKRGGVLAQGAAVDCLAAPLQQKQLVKGLHIQSIAFSKPSILREICLMTASCASEHQGWQIRVSQYPTADMAEGTISTSLATLTCLARPGLDQLLLQQ